MFRFKEAAFRLTTLPGEVTIQAQEFQNVTDIAPAMEIILQQIYLIASMLPKTAYVSTKAICFHCKCKDIVANLQQGTVQPDVSFIYEHFCCFQCRGKKSCANQVSYKEVSHVGSCQRLEAILDKYWKWMELCAALDKGSWQYLGDAFNVPPDEIFRLKQICVNNVEFSPSQHLIATWKKTKDATVENFLKILEQLGNHTARELIHKWSK